MYCHCPPHRHACCLQIAQHYLHIDLVCCIHISIFHRPYAYCGDMPQLATSDCVKRCHQLFISDCLQICATVSSAARACNIFTSSCHKDRTSSTAGMQVVGCIVEHEGKILLCKRGIEPCRGKWTLPAGYMELRESSAGTVISLCNFLI